MPRSAKPEEQRRRKVLGAPVSEEEKGELEDALRQVFERPGPGARVVLLAWKEGTLIPTADAPLPLVQYHQQRKKAAAG